ncbi:ComEA family DNA-binding protein [Paenibacillus soyae]|uniref:ComEA family DNA-binding protein n=1 Tax=Paenibacillus soyae TaxID=2969249 RepID=A0A9X2MM79_9BACL|nr:ComEA family DNA-binding protein [Paenibacillus soyae]MCR2803216.1 ComEA family DNA-binding protein [Paenibacillus soyae]
MRVKNGRIAIGNLRFAMVTACLAGAVLLFALAIAGENKKNESEGGWIPLNEAVQEKITELQKEAADPGKDGPKKGTPLTAQAQTGERPTEPAGTGAEPADQAVEETGGPDDTKPSLPGTGESAPAGGVGTTGEAAGEDTGKLDINRATVEQLDGLKGIGPSKAQAIVEDRERLGYFASVDDLLRVKGIGEKLLEGLKESVVANP